jgi:hypothetical protein
MMAPVQVRITGAPDDVTRLAEYLAGLPDISASPAEVRNRPSGIAQGYLTVILTVPPRTRSSALEKHAAGRGRLLSNDPEVTSR